MNANFLGTTGGRIAHAALSLAFALVTYVSFSAGGPLVTRWTGVGIVAIILGFVAAAVLSVREYFTYTLAILVLVPVAGFLYLLGLDLSVGRGPGIGIPFAAVGAVVFVVGLAIGLVPVKSERARETVGAAREHEANAQQAQTS